jgi:hypothetical protein
VVKRDWFWFLYLQYPFDEWPSQVQVHRRSDLLVLDVVLAFWLLMYTFSQHSGVLRQNGLLVHAGGWAGQGEGKNNPSMQNVPNIGPLPRGHYLIGRAYTHVHLGPIVMNLTPAQDNEMFWRYDFRIHGAAFKNPELSSHGCIIQPRDIRIRIDIGSDKLLEVVE